MNRIIRTVLRTHWDAEQWPVAKLVLRRTLTERSKISRAGWFSWMNCPRCQHDNPPKAKFCLECGARLVLSCAQCAAELPPSAKSCLECGTRVPAGTPASRFNAPAEYTPKHLAERIINSKASIEGERKFVTVLFADVKCSTELLADRDPEEARKLLDPVLEHMIEAVHRFEGTVKQVMGDGIMAPFGRR